MQNLERDHALPTTSVQTHVSQTHDISIRNSQVIITLPACNGVDGRDEENNKNCHSLPYIKNTSETIQDYISDSKAAKPFDIFPKLNYSSKRTWLRTDCVKKYKAEGISEDFFGMVEDVEIRHGWPYMKRKSVVISEMKTR